MTDVSDIIFYKIYTSPNKWHSAIWLADKNAPVG